ncbi:MAG: hypothetical protein HC875_28470 [Anaerolineales bacterium]|nr:hypothetical protein [Anaerolineales bacterium]
MSETIIFEQPLPPPIEVRLHHLQSKHNSTRKAAAIDLGSLNISNEQIITLLEKVATLDSSKEVAQAAHNALQAPAHQKVLIHLRRQSIISNLQVPQQGNGVTAFKFLGRKSATNRFKWVPISDTESSIELTREKMSRSITYSLAAAYIASKNFPKKENLPGSHSTPFQ